MTGALRRPAWGRRDTVYNLHSTPVEVMLDRFPDARRVGAEWLALCPHHDDRRPSFSFRENEEGAVVATCRAGCDLAQVLAAVGLTYRDLYPGDRTGWRYFRTSHRRPVPPAPRWIEPVPVEDRDPRHPDGPRILERWSESRGFDVGAARSLGLEILSTGYVRFPYLYSGQVVGWQDRRLLAGEPRWRTRPGPIPCPYNVDVTRRTGAPVFVVEGATDAIALLSSVPDCQAVGIPGVSGLKAEWVHLFAGLHVIASPDSDEAGDRLRARVHELLGPVARSVTDLVVPVGHKDHAAWRQADPADHALSIRHAVEEAR